MARRNGDGRHPLAPLAGFSIGVAAAWRREEQVAALRRRGALVVGGPVEGLLPLVEVEALESATDALLQTPPDVILIASEPCFETWLGLAEASGREPALRRVLDRSRVVVGPGSPAGPGIRRVAVQVDAGRAAAKWASNLREAGVEVIEIPVPTAGPIDDDGPTTALVEAVADRRLDAVTFTTAAEVRRLAELAAAGNRAADLRSALSGDVLPVCLGRSSAEAAAELGVSGIVRPAAPRLGAMVELLAERLGATALRLSLAGTEVILQGAAMVVGGKERWLAERERAVLEELARRPGNVVAKGDLLRRVWRSDGVDGADRHAVEVVVARLRRRLGPAGAGLQTVPRRGYRLGTDPVG